MIRIITIPDEYIQSNGEGSQAWSTALDLGSSLEGVQGFESLPSHFDPELQASVSLFHHLNKRFVHDPAMMKACTRTMGALHHGGSFWSACIAKRSIASLNLVLLLRPASHGRSDSVLMTRNRLKRQERHRVRSTGKRARRIRGRGLGGIPFFLGLGGWGTCRRRRLVGFGRSAGPDLMHWLGGASDRGKNREERASIDEQGPAGRRLDQD